MRKSFYTTVFTICTGILLFSAGADAFWFDGNKAVRTHMEVGEYVAHQGDYARAAMYYEKAWEEKPRSKPVMFTLGALYQKLSEYDKAYDVYTKMLTYYPLDPDVHKCLGNVWLARDNPVKAIKWFRKAADLNREDATAYRNLGFAQLLGGAVHGAIASLERAYKLDPDDPLTSIDLAVAYNEGGRHDDARTRVHAALKAHDSAEFRATYAEILTACAGDRFTAARAAYNSNHFQRAIVLLTQLVETYPDFAVGWTYLGHCYHHQKPSQPGKAEAAYRRALQAHELAPLDKTTHVLLLDNLGMIRMNFGDFEEAEELFAEAVSRDTAYPVVYFNYGLVLAHRRAYAPAAVAFADAVRRDRRFLEYVTHHAALKEFRASHAYTNLLSTFKPSLSENE